MQLKKSLTSLGLAAVTASLVLTGPAAFAAPTTGGSAPASVSAAAVAAAPVVLVSPGLGALMPFAKPTFTGTGDPGATITITNQDDVVIATTLVSDQGTWSAKSTVSFAPMQNDGLITQAAIDGSTSSTDWSVYAADEPIED